MFENCQSVIRRYLEKITGIEDPYLITASELRKDDFPPVTNTDIFNYLVLGHSFCTAQQFKAHKSLDAFKYFICGFVNYLGSKRFDGKYAAVAKVHQNLGDYLLNYVCYRLGIPSELMIHQ